MVEYLGRYTHKIAISNHRLKDVSDGHVTFSAKDYRKGGKKQTLGLTHKEFIRRFALHILPKGFVRIRHYGILSSCKKKVLVPLLHKELGKPIVKEPPPLKHRKCPYCKLGSMVTVTIFDSRGPPKIWLKRLKNNAPNTTP